MEHHKTFSAELESWLKKPGPKTLAKLNKLFAERTFAIAIFLLMFLPAMPLPTGGFSHVFEVISMLLALEMIVGRRTVWLPKKWLKKELGGLTTDKIMPRLIKTIRWLERFSRPRLQGLLKWRWTDNIFGIAIFLFCLTAFLAPPFSGLDTFPSIGVELIVLSLILADGAFAAAGLVVGALGILIVVGLSDLVLTLIRG